VRVEELNFVARVDAARVVDADHGARGPGGDRAGGAEEADEAELCVHGNSRCRRPRVGAARRGQFRDLISSGTVPMVSGFIHVFAHVPSPFLSTCAAPTSLDNNHSWSSVDSHVIPTPCRLL